MISLSVIIAGNQSTISEGLDKKIDHSVLFLDTIQEEIYQNLILPLPYQIVLRFFVNYISRHR